VGFYFYNKKGHNEMSEHSIRQLAAAVVLQAVKDFFNGSAAKKKIILADLRSPWVKTLTNGTSKNVAEQLEKHPEEIRERFRRHSKGEKVKWT
jgi:hypothetical protein